MHTSWRYWQSENPQETAATPEAGDELVGGDLDWLGRLLEEHAANIQAEVRAGRAAADPETTRAHLTKARTLARVIVKVIDAQMRPKQMFNRIDPIMRVPPAWRDDAEARPALSRRCATCAHWYPDGARRYADRGSCRKPALSARVQAGRGQWPTTAGEERCQDWMRTDEL